MKRWFPLQAHLHGAAAASSREGGSQGCQGNPLPPSDAQNIWLRTQPMCGLFLVVLWKSNTFARAKLWIVGLMDLGWGLSLVGCRKIHPSIPAQAGVRAWRVLQAAACSRQAGLTHLEAARVMQELGSKCPHSSELLPIAAAVLVLCGPQRDTAALWLVFLLFRPISLLSFFFIWETMQPF